MNRTFVKPETYLKRSEDLLALGTPSSEQQALDSLIEVFQSKRFKQTPLTTLEPILLLFLKLCTSLRKPRLARDALSLYKIAAQALSIPSVEMVLGKFLEMAEGRLREAREEVDKKFAGEGEGVHASVEGYKVAVDTEDGTEATESNKPTVPTPIPGQPQPTSSDEDDLELPLQPATLLYESLIADAASSTNDDGLDKDRAERKLVLPWLRFAWEAYKTCLDVSKSNARLEPIYHRITLQAFKFCTLHNRKSEFRRLTEQLRKDLSNAQKYSHQLNSINFSDPDTLSRTLDSRFAQLDTAVGLELWQEAFRSIEDVHGLLSFAGAQGKGRVKREMMKDYYEKLTRIFSAESGTGQMAVFHAAAWARYMQMVEAPGVAAGAGASAGAADKAPGCVLLSALAVPLSQVEGAVTGDGRNALRLTALLNLSKMPTRAGLLREILNKNILRRVPSQLVDLYKAIEVEFHPLTAAKTIAPLISELSKDTEYASYIRGLRSVVLTRLLQSLSQIYSTISISHVIKLLKPFATGPWETNEKDLEKFLMGASKRGELQVKIDHVTKAVTFQQENVVKPVILSEITNLQDISATGQESQIAKLALALQNTIQFLNPSILEDAKAARAAAFAEALAQAEEERKAAIHRQAIVDKRRQKLEEMSSRREKEEATAKAERARLAAEEAATREAEMYKERERERVRKEIESLKAEEAKKLAETLKARGGLKVDIEKMDQLDTDKLLQLQSQQIEKEQREIAERMRIISKRVDHLERAFRREERPLVEADYENQQAADREAHKAAVKAAQEAAIEKHQNDLALKSRLSKMLSDYQKAKEVIESQRKGEFAQKKATADKKIVEEKAALKKKIMAERAEQRKKDEAERAAREKVEREEAERAEAEEKAQAAAAAKAEEEARATDERRAAREAQRQADAEAAKKRVADEEERERRRAAERNAPPTRTPVAVRPPTASATPAAASAAPAEGGRRRLQLAPRSTPVPAAAAPAAAAPAATPAPAAAPAATPAPAAAPASTPAPAAATPAAAPASTGAWQARRTQGLAPPTGPGLARTSTPPSSRPPAPSAAASAAPAEGGRKRLQLAPRSTPGPAGDAQGGAGKP